MPLENGSSPCGMISRCTSRGFGVVATYELSSWGCSVVRSSATEQHTKKRFSLLNLIFCPPTIILPIWGCKNRVRCWQSGAPKPVQSPNGNYIPLPSQLVGHQPIQCRAALFAAGHATYSSTTCHPRRAAYSRNSTSCISGLWPTNVEARA
jgi:hypothetical protein